MKIDAEDICMYTTFAGILCIIVGVLAALCSGLYDKIVALYKGYGALGDFVLTAILIGVGLFVAGLIGVNIVDYVNKKKRI